MERTSRTQATPADGTAERSTPDDALARVMASATRLGVEINEREAAEWVAAMENEATGGDLVMDVDTGVYGHRISMLDFKTQDLARFREMAKVVGFDDRPPQVLRRLRSPAPPRRAR